MKANNALVLIWRGNQIPNEAVKAVGEVLISHNVCIPEMLTAKVMDETSMSHILAGNVAKSSCNIVENDTAEVVKHAIVYIGERFETSLKTTGSFGNIAFAVELSNAVSAARRNASFVGTDELLTAIEILSTTNAIIPAALAKKYHFTQNVVDIIKKVYNSY